MNKLMKYDTNTLAPTAKWLHALELPAKISRHRAKIMTKINAKLAEFDADRLEIIKKHCLMDGEKPKVTSEGNVMFKSDSNKMEFVKEFNELVEEPVVLDLTELEFSCQLLFEYFENDYDEKIGGDDALLFERFMEHLEAIGGD